ncbi:MAG: hypothetical protein ACUVRH_03035 [Candidatus Bipolaricaulia bacterium]
MSTDTKLGELELEGRLSRLYQLLRRGRIPRRGLLRYLAVERGLEVERLESLPLEELDRLIRELRDQEQRALILERVLTIDMEPLFPELAIH